MIETMDKIVSGDVKVISYYQKALERWETILAQPGAQDPDRLAEILTEAQDDFEEDCEFNRGLAKEILAVAGIVRLYDVGCGFEGHEDDVHLVRLGIARSHCSLEVKFAARDVAQY